MLQVSVVADERWQSQRRRPNTPCREGKCQLKVLSWKNVFILTGTRYTKVTSDPFILLLETLVGLKNIVYYLIDFIKKRFHCSAQNVHDVSQFKYPRKINRSSFGAFVVKMESV